MKSRVESGNVDCEARVTGVMVMLTDEKAREREQYSIERDYSKEQK